MGTTEIVKIDVEYDKFIEKLIESNSTLTIQNNSSSHALSILRNIFKYANSHIYLFTDKLVRNVYNDPVLVDYLKKYIEKPGSVLKLVYR